MKRAAIILLTLATGPAADAGIVLGVGGGDPGAEIHVTDVVQVIGIGPGSCKCSPLHRSLWRLLDIWRIC